MPTLTLAEFIKRTRDELVAGVAWEILTTNPIWGVFPWVPYAGSGVTVNRETTESDSEHLDIGDTITAKNPMAVTPALFRSTTTLGDAEINDKFIQESASDINDVVAMEVAGKAKSVGRKLQAGMATGDGVAPNLNSFHSLVDAGQYVTAGADVFDTLDLLIDKVKSKDGYVDFIMCHGRDMRKIRSAYRALGGVPMVEVEVGDRTIQMDSFEGIPIFQNDWLSITETAGGAALVGGALSSIYAGNWDDGTKKVGCAMIYPQAGESLGLDMEEIGPMQAKDERIYRVKSYSNFVIFNNLGAARATDNAA